VEIYPPPGRPWHEKLLTSQMLFVAKCSCYNAAA